MKSPIPRGGNSGGVVSSRLSTTSESRSRCSSYAGNTSASCLENFAISASGLGAILPHEEMAAVGEGREESGIFGVHLVAEARELEFADDAFLKQAGEIGRGGDAVAGPDFFGDRAAAHQLALFEHQHFASGAGEVGRGDQAVVAAANDDYVVFSQLTIVTLIGNAVAFDFFTPSDP